MLTGIGLSAGPPGGGTAARERWESLAAIAQLADDMHAARPEATMSDFSAELTLRAELGHAPGVEGVTLASMHAAKGLEWDAVFLPGLVEGLMPLVHARSADALEEERRLLYVGMKRARQHLYLFLVPGPHAGQPEPRARGQGGQRSRFLDDVRIGRKPWVRRSTHSSTCSTWSRSRSTSSAGTARTSAGSGCSAGRWPGRR